MTLAKSSPYAATIGAVVLLGFACAEDKEGFTPLFNGKDLSGFQTVLGRQGEPQVKDGVINFSGRPDGYMHTDRSYKDYAVRFDRKLLRDGGVGTLVRVAGSHKLWPKCIEIQGSQVG